MVKKEFTKKNLKEIKRKLINKNYLERSEIQQFIKKFNFCSETFKRELLRNKIPFKSAKIKVTLLSIGIVNDGKNIEYSNLKKLNKWKIELLKDSKIKIKFNCKCCNNNSALSAKNMLRRAYLKLEPICAKCILKEVPNLEEWKAKNSASQFISQNKKDILENNRKRTLELQKNKSYVKRRNKGIKRVTSSIKYKERQRTDALKRWENPEYAIKILENSKNSIMSGFYKNLYYNSSYELAFLLLQEKKGNFKKIKRAQFYIPYINSKGKWSHYFPDYIFDKKYLIEIKGFGPWVDLNNLSLKNKYAKKWCEENNKTFRLILKEDLGNTLLRKAKKIHNEIKNKKNNSLQRKGV